MTMAEQTQNDALRFADLPDTFEALCRMHPPRPIHDDAELARASDIIDAMAGHELNADQADYLDTLSTLVESYEDQHDPADTSGVTGGALLGSLMEANDLTAGDVAEILGTDRSLVSHVLAGRRGLTWGHAKALAERFAVAPAAFMG
jgi:HTH-type transcriptional regulator/antitoxin HigA